MGETNKCRVSSGDGKLGGHERTLTWKSSMSGGEGPELLTMGGDDVWCDIDWPALLDPLIMFETPLTESSALVEANCG